MSPYPLKRCVAVTVSSALFVVAGYMLTILDQRSQMTNATRSSPTPILSDPRQPIWSAVTVSPHLDSGRWNAPRRWYTCLARVRAHSSQ